MSDPTDDKKDAIEQLDLEQRYIDWQELGQGGMGKVFVARDKMLDKRVAIKLLHSDVDSKAVVRFQQEAKVLSKLSHKYIVKIMDFYYSKNGQLFLVMEYIVGSSLETVLEDKERLAPEDALRIATQLSQALIHAHSQGIVHRDLKPANVMIDNDGNAKILDFGIAKLISGSEIFGTLTKAGQLIGSPMYMSPEQLRGDSVNELSDVYGLGLLVYTMIAGQPPFGHSNLVESLQQRQQESPPSLQAYVEDPKLCAGLDALVARALHPDMNQRYATMSEFEEQLSALLAFTSLPPEIDTTAVNKRISAPITKKQVLLSSIFLALFALAVYIGMAIKSQAERKIVATVSDTTKIEVYPDTKTKVFRPDRIDVREKQTITEPIKGFTFDKTLKAFWKAPDPITAENLKQLQASNVRFITFDGNNSFTPGMLKYLPRKQLQGLILSKTRLVDKDLSELKNFENLAWLNLGFTNVSNSGIKTLAPLKRLRRLNIQGCKGITDKVIPLLKQFPHLNHLHLSSTGVTRNGVIQLQDQKFMRLALCGLNVTDDDVIGFTEVVHFNLSDCDKITDKAMFQFAKQKFPRYIDVTRCPLVTFEGIRDCKMAGKEVMWAPPKSPVNTKSQQDVLDLFDGMPDSN